MLIDSLHHEFVERCPVLGFEIVAIHGCAEILYRPAAEVGVDLKFLTSINIPNVVDLVFYPVVSKSSSRYCNSRQYPLDAQVISFCV